MENVFEDKMILEEIKELLTLSWSYETCSPGLKKEWNKENPSLGQCAVTSLIVNDFFGGKIMRCMTTSGSHYYNLIDNNIVDLTVSQFNEPVDYSKGESRTREYLLSNEETKERYIKLLNIVKNNFIKYGNKDYRLLSINGEYLSKVPGILGGNKKLKIYGKLDCPSARRWLDLGYYENNRVFFENLDYAEELGYRPCSVCMRKEYESWKIKNNKM